MIDSPHDDTRLHDDDTFGAIPMAVARYALERSALGTLGDGDLLECFRTDRGASGQEAFRILVERHGPMVLGLCRSLIPDRHEAEDAFQATFLVLVRKGRTIWVRDSVGPWLYGVASRVARRVRRRTNKRRRSEIAIAGDVADTRQPALFKDIHAHEADRSIHEEIARLPASLRDPLVLCALQGLTYDAAARQLGVPEPTVRGRLRRGRSRLATRLRERGVVSSLPAGASLFTMESFSLDFPALPTAVARKTVQYAVWWSSMSGLVDASLGVPESIALLAQGAVRSMLLSACRFPGIVVLVAAGVLATAVWAQPAAPRVRGAPARVAAGPRPRSSPRDGAVVPAAQAVAQPARPGKRVIQGRLIDGKGLGIPDAKVMFGPENVLVSFSERATSVSDAEGRFQIELSEFPFGDPETLPATGPLRYMVLVPGFHSEVGKVDAGTEPASLNLQLSAEEWSATEIRLVDIDGRPVSGAELAVQVGAPLPWSHEKSDTDGRVLVKSPRGQGFSVEIRRAGFLPTRFGSRTTPLDPTKFTVPLYASIRGRVVDPSGKPIEGIQVGRLIAPSYAAGLGKPGADLEVYPVAGATTVAVTDSDGRFEVAPRVTLDHRTGKLRVFPLAVCFADAALRRVHFLRVDVDAPRRPYEITLRSARHVRIPLEHEVTLPLGALVVWWDLYALAGADSPDHGVFVSSDDSQRKGVGGEVASGDWIDAHLPEGKYHITVNSAERDPPEGAEETSAEFVVPPGDGPVVLPPLRMKVLPLRGLVGKPAPEIDAKDLKTGRPVKLADYKGKVVVLDFWGYWCGPCIGSMPALIRAFDQYKGKPVTIIAVHDQSIQSREEYDQRLTEIKRQAWGNRELPFHVALDHPEPDVPAGESAIGKGITCKRYQIQAFPTTLVIDQDGKVAGHVNVRENGRLDAMLGKLLNRAEQK